MHASCIKFYYSSIHLAVVKAKIRKHSKSTSFHRFSMILTFIESANLCESIAPLTTGRGLHTLLLWSDLGRWTRLVGNGWGGISFSFFFYKPCLALVFKLFNIHRYCIEIMIFFELLFCLLPMGESMDCLRKPISNRRRVDNTTQSYFTSTQLYHGET